MAHRLDMRGFNVAKFNSTNAVLLVVKDAARASQIDVFGVAVLVRKAWQIYRDYPWWRPT